MAVMQQENFENFILFNVENPNETYSFPMTLKLKSNPLKSFLGNSSLLNVFNLHKYIETPIRKEMNILLNIAIIIAIFKFSNKVWRYLE